MTIRELRRLFQIIVECNENRASSSSSAAAKDKDGLVGSEHAALFRGLARTALNKLSYGVRPDPKPYLQAFSTKSLPECFRTSDVAKLDKLAEHSIAEVINPTPVLAASMGDHQSCVDFLEVRRVS